MHRSLLSFLTPFVFATAALGQSAPTDSQTLQALLVEVRQLRHDLRTTTATAQRAQIALYRLQRQDEAVARANQRLSEARARLDNAVANRNEVASQIQQTEAMAKNSQNPEERNHFDEVVLPELKSRLEGIGKEEQQARAREAEAEQHLRDEQIKLDGLNDLLDRFNNALEEIGRK